MSSKRTKIIINRCYGGFSLSSEARTRMKELGYVYVRSIERVSDEELGVKNI